MTEGKKSFGSRVFSWFRAHPDFLIAAALFVGTVALVGATADSIGFTRDEGYYFKAAKAYAGWFSDVWRMFGEGKFTEPFSKEVIDRRWSYNHEHPALVKTTMALSWLWLKENLGLFSLHSSAIRFPAWCFAGLSVALTYSLARSLLPRRTSLLAAAMWLAMPRAFWQMHLACFDIAVCAAHLWLVYAYLRCRFTTTGAFVIALAFAMATAVKHNVLVAPAFFVLHWALTEARGYASKATGVVIPRVPLAFFTLAFVSPVLFALHWPYLWPDLFRRIGFWIGFHLSHEHYPILWFGDLLTSPPFPVSFPFVMSGVTIPLPILLVMIAGIALSAWVSLRHIAHHLWNARAPDEVTAVSLGAKVVSADGEVKREASGIAASLLLLNAAFPFVLIALPSTPIFGGTKHWMNALPFLCILGAWAIEEGLVRGARAFVAWRSLDGKPRGRPVEKRASRIAMVAFVGLFVLVIAPGIAQTTRIHPYGLSSYNSVIGFARGAASVGMQRTFWGYEVRAALPLINARAPKGSIHFGDTNRDDYRAYVADGLLRKDLRFSGRIRNAAVASVQPQGEFKRQWMRVQNEMEVDGPDDVVHIEGVPLLTVNFKSTVKKKKAPAPSSRAVRPRPRAVPPVAPGASQTIVPIGLIEPEKKTSTSTSLSKAKAPPAVKRVEGAMGANDDDKAGAGNEGLR